VTNEYRRAELIELHDSNVKIHPQNYSDAVAGWKEYSNKEVFVLEGESIGDLAKFFGHQPKTLTVTAGDPPKRYKHEINSQKFHIARKITEDIGSGYTSTPYEGSHKIGELWAKLLGERQIEIKFTSLFEDESEVEEQETVFVTYSGSYTVWWAKE
jgi:hypothetical protein